VTLRGRKFRLYPTAEQAVFLERHFGCTRKVYNHFLEVREKTYKETGKSPSTLECKRRLVEFKEQFPFLKEMNSQSLQRSVLDLGKAYDRFFTKLGKYPRFKSKKNGHQSFSVPQNFRLTGNKLFIPKLKTGIPMVQHRPLGGPSKSLTISKTPSGKYFVSVLCEAEGKPHKIVDKVVGLDGGIKTLLKSSDGKHTPNPRFMKHARKSLARAQRSLSRKRKDGKNRAKAKLRVARLHEHVANQRRDYLHKTSRRVVDDNQVICLEDLFVAGMMRNHCLGAALADTGLGELKRQVLYKASDAGRRVVELSRWYASSKTCSVCKCVNHSLTLSDRTWTCANCGVLHDRDDNAAQNLKQEGIAGLRENLKVSKPSKRLPLSFKGRRTGAALSSPARETASTQHTRAEQAGSLKQEAIRVSSNVWGSECPAFQCREDVTEGNKRGLLGPPLIERGVLSWNGKK